MSLYAAPRVRIESGSCQLCELRAARVVVTGTVVPMTSVRHLKLDSTECIKRRLIRRWPRAEDQKASLVIRMSRDVTHRKAQPKTAKIARGV